MVNVAASPEARAKAAGTKITKVTHVIMNSKQEFYTPIDINVPINSSVLTCY